MLPLTLPPELTAVILALASALHARVGPRLLPLFAGAFFARGRRTVTSWLRAAAIGPAFRLYYYALGSLGRKVEHLAGILLRHLLRRCLADGPLVFALDDSPTKRYGPWVEGAGIHHNPTPGPAGQKFLYGHVWVTLAWALEHAAWGPVALPLLARLYVRQKDLGQLPPWYQWTFRTKLELAADLIRWLAGWLGLEGRPVWLVVDGAYAKRPFLKVARELGMVAFSRLRKDAALYSLPEVPPEGRRGPGQPRKYGTQAYSLAKRAGQGRGWQTVEVEQYRQRLVKTYKSFPATWRPAGGAIGVVLVREEGGEWVPFFCTDPGMPVATILKVVADRGTIEQAFHDVKEVEGAGQQQLRNVWANVGAFHLCLWAYTLVAYWAWDRPQGRLSDRAASPWDDPGRRPSHADRRKALQRHVLRQEFLGGGRGRPVPRRIRALLRVVLALAG